jgi:hypothetical protein
MHLKFLPLFILIALSSFGQKDTTTWVRGFPITEYILDINDSIKLVQVQLPAGTVIGEKQIGLLKGIYRGKLQDTATIGSGRCNLIKGAYYYFTINYKHVGKTPAAGDLLYVLMKKTPVYNDHIIPLVRQFIGLKNVYDQALYDRYTIFSRWQKKDEEALIDSMVSDIHFTGDYFLRDNPSMNVNIKSGRYEGKMVLNTMKECRRKDVIDFLGYMSIRPRLYAGQEWKIAEIFATWLSEGAPTLLPTPKGE